MARVKWGKNDLAHLRALNTIFIEKEKRIMEFHQLLNTTSDEMIVQRKIDDYNHFWNLALFSKNHECNERQKAKVGTPFYEYRCWLPLCCDFNAEIEGGGGHNWNEYNHSETHPLGKEFFCYTMHCILFDIDISIEDIRAINHVTMELKLEYQWVTNEVQYRWVEKELPKTSNKITNNNE